MLSQKAVKAIIVDKSKFILLQRNPLVRDSDNWDLPGGLVEDGESEEYALIREVKEELNIDIEITKSVGEWSFFRSKDQKTVSVKNYVCKIVGSNIEIELSEEHKACRWIGPSEIINLKLKDNSLKENILKLSL